MTAPGPDCREVFQQLDDYIDRELSPEEARTVLSHLERCAQCAEEFAVERDVLDVLKEKLRHIQAPAGLMGRILERLEGEGGQGG